MPAMVMAPAIEPAMKIGALARQTGLTVRTLHYYDEIGLLSPSERTESGYRLYTAGDIARLQQIMSLRQLGFGLEEIRDCLYRPAFSPQRVIEMHLARIREQIELENSLCRRLEAIAAGLRRARAVSVEEFIQTIEEIKKMETHFTPEQMAEIKERGRKLGPEHIKAVEAEWPLLIAKVRAEMEKGTDPADPRVQALAGRWGELVKEFTGGNPGIEQALGKRYQQEPELRQQTGIDTQMFEYVNKATEAAEEIYPMPSFPILNVTDLAASARWYQEALGFRHIFTMSGPEGIPLLVHLRWVKYADVLLGARPVAPGPRGLGVAFSFSAYLAGRPVDEIAERAEAAGSKILASPAATPWNTRECTISDPDGYRLTFTEPINTVRSFDEVIREAAQAGN